MGDLAGVAVGHWTDAEARTGVTVVILPEGSTASAEVRGGAPATREFDVLAPSATVTRLDAVVLSGGSAFGLASVDGVVSTLAEAGRGFVTAGGVVPIVAGMSLFDLTVGSAQVRLGAAEGAAAAATALSAVSPPGAEPQAVPESMANAIEGGKHAVGQPAVGQRGVELVFGAVGAGTGATVSKWRGRDHAAAGGLVTATVVEGGFSVSALVAVNAFGDVVGHGPAGEPWPSLVPPGEVGAFGADGSGASSAGTNTTLGVIVTDAALSKGECLLLAQGAHDGYARAITPPHCRVDGDAVVAAATGAVPLADPSDPRRVAQVELLRWMAVRATVDALATLADVAPTGPIPWMTPPAEPGS
ncbi:MAG: P1 family peptidase [Acidimicrobiales bacterium]|jgi:L-aminopeptidase/D-esterase-like protein|nr:P1 family peptidase [Acidimicrobiales bacterium]